MSNIVARGTAQAAAERDFTVKVDAGSLKPGATYYYAFDSGGEQSPSVEPRHFLTAVRSAFASGR